MKQEWIKTKEGNLVGIIPGAPAPYTDAAKRNVMNGKPVFTRAAKTVINFESHFKEKFLCDGPTFSAGDACVYSCSFCYVPDLVRKLRATAVMKGVEGRHEDIVIRRAGAVGESPAAIAERQLRNRHDRGRGRSLRSHRSLPPNGI